MPRVRVEMHTGTMDAETTRAAAARVKKRVVSMIGISLRRRLQDRLYINIALFQGQLAVENSAKNNCLNTHGHKTTQMPLEIHGQNDRTLKWCFAKKGPRSSVGSPFEGWYEI